MSPLSPSRKIEVTAALVAILLAAMGILKAYVLIPYEISELQAQAAKASGDHDVLTRVDSNLQNLIKEVESQHRDMQILLRVSRQEEKALPAALVPTK